MNSNIIESVAIVSLSVILFGCDSSKSISSNPDEPSGSKTSLLVTHYNGGEKGLGSWMFLNEDLYP